MKLFVGTVFSAMILAPLFMPLQGGRKVWFCNRIHEDKIESLPKGWRRCLLRLYTWLDCEGTSGILESASGLKLARSEKYLAGLEAPGLYFRVDIEKQEDEKVGFGVTPRGDYLEVEKLSGSGALARWNGEHALRAVAIKDRIIIINGIEGNATVMADELRNAASISLRLFRISESDKKAIEARKADKEVMKVIKIRPPVGLGAGIPEPPGSKVVVLHANNALKFIEMQPVALVMFYASWCGHCQQAAPVFTRAAELLAEEKLPLSARIAKIDDQDPINQPLRLGHDSMFNFTSYPTMIVFKNGKKEFFAPDGGAEEYVAALRAAVLSLDPDKEVSKALLRTKPMLYKADTPSEVIYDLEVDNFDDIVLKESDGNNAVWIIEFYSDKCPFCQSLKPEIIKASKKLNEKFKGKVRVGAVNSRAFGEIAKRFGVTSYPWIISVYANKKIDDMAGLGGWESVFEWGVGMHKKVWKAKPKWSMVPILVPAEPTDSNKDRGTKEMGMFSNTTGSWRELLGRRTWFFLHTLAAKYPPEPSEKDKEGMRHIVAGLGQHYPCPICRLHLQKKLVDPELGPVPVDNRQDLATWFCRLHNLVNDDLGKPQQPCNAFQLDLQYLKSCGECSANATDLPDEAKQAAAAWDITEYYKGALPVATK